MSSIMYAVSTPTPKETIVDFVKRLNKIGKNEDTQQNPHLFLREIIWEITGECQNACKYCGSKSEWKQKTSPETILSIANAISQYPPEEIDISGGDPTLVDMDTLKAVYAKFKNAGIKYVKILCNPQSFRREQPTDISNRPEAIKKLEIFDWIGLSINSPEDMSAARSWCWYNGVNIKNKITVITNFNLDNVFCFDMIRDVVRDLGCKWQVQYTTYKEPDHPLAIYNNDQALEYLFDKIRETNMGCDVNNPTVIVADDMNSGPCGAGKSSCGILSNGDVVGCLSMRSWEEPLQIVGNVLNRPLKDLWENEFRQYRFCSYKSCKDHCKNKVYNPQKRVWPELVPSEIVGVDPNSNLYPYPESPQVVMYAVTPDYGHVSVYAVTVP